MTIYRGVSSKGKGVDLCGSASGGSSYEYTQSSPQQPLKKCVVRHTIEQVNSLRYYYEMGMRGSSKKHRVLIQKAATRRTGLTAEQVKIFIML